MLHRLAVFTRENERNSLPESRTYRRSHASAAVNNARIAAGPVGRGLSCQLSNEQTDPN
jgi:hypothetical protein